MTMSVCFSGQEEMEKNICLVSKGMCKQWQKQDVVFSSPIENRHAEKLRLVIVLCSQF